MGRNKQILHLKVGCSDFGPVRDRDSLLYCAGKLTVQISALFGTKAVYHTQFTINTKNSVGQTERR